MRKTVLSAFAVVFLFSPAVVGASTVTFDDVVVVPDNVIIVGTRTSGGFDFTSDHWHVVNDDTGLASDGTQYAALDSPTLAFPLTMTKSGGGTFSLTSFVGAELFVNPPGGFPNADFIRVVGNLFGGGTITQDFALDGIIDSTGGAADFQNFVFGAGFNNLTSAVWDGFLVTGSRASISLDNIVTDGATAVPEPGTLLCLGTGVAALLRRRRRQR